MKIFRKIRNHLIYNNKLRKYFFYAVGEIVLVVIGILIALQINNRNEHQKNLEKEILYLKQLRLALLNDLETKILPFQKSNNENINTINLYLKHLNNYPNSISKDSIRTLHSHWFVPLKMQINTTVFENLNSVGIDLISNDKLRLEISNYYGFEINKILSHNKDNHEWNRLYLYPHYLKNVTIDSTEFSSEDIEFLKNDLFTKNLHNVTKGYFHLMNTIRSEELISKTENLINNIETEIETLEK